MRDDPAFLEGGLDDELLGLAHHDGLLVQLADAARLAEGGTDAAGEFGEVAVHGKKLVRPLEVALEDGEVLVGDEVAERTSGTVAEGRAAVLAALDLRLQVSEREGLLNSCLRSSAGR